MECKEDINIALRSVLNSSTVPLTINDLFKDYIKLTGEPVPLRKLGFRSLHEYLRTIPDVVSLDDPNSPHSVVRAVSNAKTRHIVNFVKGQKAAKPPSRYGSRRPLPRFRGIQNDFVPYSLNTRIFEYLRNYPEGVHMDDFKCIVDSFQEQMHLMCDFRLVLSKIAYFTNIDGDYISLMKTHLSQNSHNAAVPKRPNEMIVVSSDELSDDGSYLDFLSETDSDCPIENVNGPNNNAGRASSDNIARPHSGPSHSAAESRCSSRSGIELVSDTLIKNFYALLDENPNGIWLTDLAKKYQTKYGYGLNPQQHGFDCVLDMVSTLKNVFYMMQYEKSGDRHLRDARKVQAEHEVIEDGELPKSVVNDIIKLLKKRDKPQLYTDELASEFKKFYNKTLDPIEYGFFDMNGLLKALSDNESSIFCFKPLKQRTLMYLRDSYFEERKTSGFTQGDSALPDDMEYDIIPKEVCNYDYRLPVNPMLKELTRGRRIKVRIAEVYSPERFFVHFVDDVRDLNLMMEDLHQFYEMNGDNYEVFHDTIRRGMLCASPFHGNSKWHRVQIVTCHGTADIKVRFIDYGTTADVSISKLRYLHLDYAKLPPMSIRTKLNGIKPKVNESQKPGYPVEVGETFFNFANVDDLEAEIVSADLVGPSIEVVLYARGECGEIIVNERLIATGLVERREILEIPPITAEQPSDTQQAKKNAKKKSRPPPGIPIPANLNPQSIPMSTVSQSSTTFNVEAPPFTASSSSSRKSSTSTTQAAPHSAASSAYSQSSIFNVQAPPFSVSSSYSQSTFNVQASPFSISSSTFSAPSSIFVQARPAMSARVGSMNPLFYPSSYAQPMQPQPQMYAPTAGYMYPRPPPVPQYNHTFVPYNANPYDFYYQPRPGTTYFPAGTQKPPPPGFNYIKPDPAPTSGTYFSGDPLYKNSTVTKGKELPKEPEMKPTIKLEKEEDDKPAWIVKLEKLRDVIEEKNISPNTASARITQVIDDISDTRSTRKETEVAPDILEDHVHHSPSKSEINDLTAKFNNLMASRSDSLKAPDSSARSENGFSVKSEDRESTRDEIRSQKIEQLRMFVMLQNRNLRKT